MKASDVMTTRVITVNSDATIKEAVRLMLQNHISGIPVVDGAGLLVGVVTEGDLLRRSELGTERRRPRWLEFLLSPGRLAEEYVHSHGRLISDIMTRNLVIAEEDVSLADIVQLMERHRIKRIPIVREGRVVGIVSRANLLHALAGLAVKTQPVSQNDTTIRARLLGELGQPNWVPRGSLNIMVEDGIVHLWGAIFDNRERDALRVAAENIPGVKGVQDHLTWIDAVSGLPIDIPMAPPEAPKQGGSAKITNSD